MGTIMAMLYQQLRRPFWLRHPLLTSAAAAWTVWLLWSGAQLLVAGLRARADFEHRLNLTGDLRGIYGRYPPVLPGWFPDPQNRSQLRYFDGALWTGYTAATWGQ
jgi:hypothetical protein